MPRRRPRTRVDQLVEALETLDHLASCLQKVDLRSTNRELRGLVKDSRTKATELGKVLSTAISIDVPSNPLGVPEQPVAQLV